MKKALAYWFTLLAILLLSSQLLVSCKSKQIINQVEKHDSISATKEVIHFSSQLNKSLGIKDTFKFSLPKITTGATKITDCDSLCNQKIKEALQNVKTSKQSGVNGYNLYYDKYSDQLVITTHLGETISSQKDSIATLNQKLAIKNEKTIEIPVIQPLTKEQTFNLWTGRLFWVLLVAVIGWKIYKKFQP